MSVLKNFDLNSIELTLKECREFCRDLILSYKVQDIKVPERVKKLKKDVENDINKIEGK